MKEDYEYEVSKLKKQLEIARKRNLDERGRKMTTGAGRRSGSAQPSNAPNFEMLYGREKEKTEILYEKL